jgi:putative two-component system response regulator
MPEMDGYEVISILKKDEKTKSIPVIFLTAKLDPENEVKGLNLGAVDYITKPFSRELLMQRIGLHILLGKQAKELLECNNSLRKEVDRKTKAVVQLQNAILQNISDIVESRDQVTGGHIERTQHYLRLLIDLMIEHNVYADELITWDSNIFIMSSQLHDVGKISIRDNILMKPGRLTNDEFKEIEMHTVIGIDIIKRMKSRAEDNVFLQHAEILVGSHHEKWDGSGYPNRLKGEEIPLQGRLMAIVDVYDALTNERPYKKAFTHEETLEVIKKGKGTHFDPLITEIFIEHEKEFETVKSIVDKLVDKKNYASYRM